jgi:hypothetical protein
MVIKARRTLINYYEIFNMSKTRLFLILVIPYLICGCNSQNKDKTQDTTVNTINNSKSKTDTINRQADTISYDYKELKKHAPDCGNMPDTGNLCTNAYFKYPEFNNQPILNTLIKNRIIHFANIDEILSPNNKIQKLDTNINNYADDFIKDYVKNHDSDPERPWELKAEATVILQDSAFIAIRFEGYHYNGGAHGIDGIYGLNFDKKTSSVLKLKDLLLNGYRKELKPIILTKFKEQQNLPIDTPLQDYGKIKNGKIPVSNNFLITKEGLLFLYNEYEVLPESEGPVEIKVPYSQIKFLIKPNTILAKYIN